MIHQNHHALHPCGESNSGLRCDKGTLHQLDNPAAVDQTSWNFFGILTHHDPGYGGLCHRVVPLWYQDVLMGSNPTIIINPHFQPLRRVSLWVVLLHQTDTLTETLSCWETPIWTSGNAWLTCIEETSSHRCMDLLKYFQLGDYVCFKDSR